MPPKARFLFENHKEAEYHECNRPNDIKIDIRNNAHVLQKKEATKNNKRKCPKHKINYLTPRIKTYIFGFAKNDTNTPPSAKIARTRSTFWSVS